MRFAQVEAAGVRQLAIEEDGEFRAIGGGETSLAQLIASERAATVTAEAGGTLRDVRLLAPLTPGKIVAIGLNYLDHINEAKMERPQRPLIFSKFPTSVIADRDPIEVDRSLTQEVDWEVELAVVVGRRMKRVSVEDAEGCIFGYTVANDVSARDLQFSDGQWTRGKSLDTFCPLGPVVVTADEVGDPQKLALGTRVNGETVQDSTTAEMLFGVAELLSFASQGFTLEPGDVVLTGTPWGCGGFMTPPRSLGDGDVVEVEVEGIGALRNPVVEL